MIVLHWILTQNIIYRRLEFNVQRSVKFYVNLVLNTI